MNGIALVEKIAEMQRQYADAHRPVRPIEQYRERHARRHPKRAATSTSRSIRPGSEAFCCWAF
jgi:hypothetical protein